MGQRRFPPPWSVEEADACFVVGAVSWSNVQRHHAEVVSGVVDIGDAYQFDNGVTGADRRFGAIRRDEVFVPLEAEVSDARTAKCVDCCILCRREGLC
jgi:hypothetical protein